MKETSTEMKTSMKTSKKTTMDDATEAQLAGIDPATQPWFHKVREFMEHVNNVSKKCCKNIQGLHY